MKAIVDPRRWSLRLRLTVYFFAATSALLGAVGWVLFHQLTHQLWEKDEATVRSIMDAQRDVVRVMANRSPVLWRREWTEHTQRRDGLVLLLTAPDGQVLGTETRTRVPAAAFPVPATQRSALRHYTLREGDKELRYMLAAQRIETAPAGAWVLQAAYELTESEELIDAFGRQVVAVMLAAVLAASALAAWLVHRGLRPLREMSEVMGGITAENLEPRIAADAWPSDLRRLASAFDAMLRRLQAAFDQLSRFSSDLAHEFRSPITNLVAAASVMLSRERSPAEYQETLAVVVDEGDRLARMVSSMLFLARADNARQALDRQRITVGELLQQVADAYEGVAEERGVRLQASGAGWLHADPILLRNALSNLVANALQHTPAGGAVTLSAVDLDGGIELAVADTGSGIAPEHLPHIFDRFYRADASRSSGDRTGLGLAVVRSIADLHGGRVTVKSQVGQGSRFALWLPRK